MSSIYDFLKYERRDFIGPLHWIGNLRWIAEEMTQNGLFIFRTCPYDQSESEFLKKTNTNSSSRRTLLGLDISDLGAVTKCIYQADRVIVTMEYARISITLPLEGYTALIKCEEIFNKDKTCIKILSASEVGRLPSVQKQFYDEIEPNGFFWSDGGYSIAFRVCGKFGKRSGGCHWISPDENGQLVIAVAFGVTKEETKAEVNRLFSNPESSLIDSKRSWEEYLNSCPVYTANKDFIWKDPDGIEVVHSKEEICRRQYWHWHCLLSNAYQLPFNALKAFIAPDKAGWFGSWSNDGPESLRALAMTSRHALARECLVEYVRTAISQDGDLSWYLHGIGEGCYGRKGDSGRLSHGVPTIVTAISEYIKYTNDIDILEADGGDDQTIWGKLRRYMQLAFERRDINRDGLVEWVNLWEGGADDKVGCFFSKADIHSWVRAVSEMSDNELQEFYAKNSCPVVNLYEQSFFLSALSSFKELACLRKDTEMMLYAEKRYDLICQVIKERHWDEGDQFFYDWDVHKQSLVRSMNQDSFYLLAFLKDSKRGTALLKHLNNSSEFGLRYIPTLAKNSQGFYPNGYWCGGYWPRETYYIARALKVAGYSSKALELTIKAICSAPGKIIRENIDPLTGNPNTSVTMMAYNVLLNKILLDN